MIDARLGEPIDLDRAIAGQFDPDFLQPQPLGARVAAGGEHQQVGFERIGPGQLDRQGAVVILGYALERAVEAEVDTLRHRNLQQPVTDLLVIAAQNRVAAIDQRYLAAEAVENTGKFIGDIAAPGDGHAARKAFEVEHLVRGDAMLGPRHIGAHRPATCGNQYMSGGDDAAIGQFDIMRPDQLRPLLDHGDLVVGQRLAINALEPGDLAQHAVAQGNPVEAGFPDRPTEFLRVLQILGEMRAVNQQLLGHAAADDAGAANAKLLRHRHLRAVRRGDARRANPARACADDEEIVVVSHSINPSAKSP